MPLGLTTSLAETVIDVAAGHTASASQHRLNLPPRAQNTSLQAATASKANQVRQKQSTNKPGSDTIDVITNLYIYPANKGAPKKVS
jgi:hypothetical protein